MRKMHTQLVRPAGQRHCGNQCHGRIVGDCKNPVTRFCILGRVAVRVADRAHNDAFRLAPDAADNGSLRSDRHIQDAVKDGEVTFPDAMRALCVKEERRRSLCFGTNDNAACVSVRTVRQGEKRTEVPAPGKGLPSHWRACPLCARAKGASAYAGAY